jgi:hypothetical protein
MVIKWILGHHEGSNTAGALQQLRPLSYVCIAAGSALWNVSRLFESSLQLKRSHGLRLLWKAGFADISLGKFRQTFHAELRVAAYVRSCEWLFD